MAPHLLVSEPKERARSAAKTHYGNKESDVQIDLMRKQAEPLADIEK